MTAEQSTFYDCALNTGQTDLLQLTGWPRIKKQIENAAQVFQGLWKYDLREGIPYFSQVLVKGPDFSIIRHVYYDLLMNVPGVLAVERLTIRLVRSERKAVIDYRVRIDNNEVGSGSLVLQ